MAGVAGIGRGAGLRHWTQLGFVLVLLPFFLGVGLSRGLSWSQPEQAALETTIILKPGQSATLAVGPELKIRVRAALR